jgi:CBS domain-containing protein
MASVRDLLRKKEKGVWTTSRDMLVSDALDLMLERNVGALVVTDEERHVLGIVTERDLVRKLLRRKKAPEETRIEEIMSSKALCVTPEYTVDACMSLMNDNQIRHLPVVEQDRLVGIVSVRDVVRTIVAEQEFMIMQLEDYIMACPPHLKSEQTMVVNEVA